MTDTARDGLVERVAFELSEQTALHGGAVVSVDGGDLRALLARIETLEAKHAETDANKDRAVIALGESRFAHGKTIELLQLAEAQHAEDVNLLEQFRSALRATIKACDGIAEPGVTDAFLLGAALEVAGRRAEDVKPLSELLAVIHRDGGQYQDAHGTAKAVADAMQLSSDRIVEAEGVKRIGELEAAGCALIADVRRRYPGEELRCEYMRNLDAALNKGPK